MYLISHILCSALILVSVLQFNLAYRILGIFPYNGKSHNIMFDALMKGLAERKYKVDVITHFPLKNPPENYNCIINLDGTLENVMNNFSINFALQLQDDKVRNVATTFGNRFCHLMGIEKMQKFIKESQNHPPYDVLITESFAANCFMGIGHLLNIPIIGVTSSVEYPWMSDFLGNCDNPAVVPTVFTVASGEMNFFERLENFVTYYSSVYKFYSWTYESQTSSMRKYLRPDFPDIREVEKSIALMLVNSHPILFGVKPISSSVINIAGLHIEEDTSNMTKELQDWMDESTHGVVYFNLGSLLVIETLPTVKMQAMLESFAKLSPIRILIKIVDIRKLPQVLPDNVLTMPWIPQIPVLSHNNTRLFITHGGLMGMIESIYYGVPTIGIPVFGDQSHNIKAMEAKNISRLLSIDDITENSLNNILNEMLFEPTYRNSAKKLSKLFRDRPMGAMDTAEFWISYIIRNGPDVLKSPALELKWWQVALLDVYGFILVILILITLVIYVITSTLYRKICGTSTRERSRRTKHD